MQSGDKVKVHYTSTLNDGTVFDSSEGKQSLKFVIGNGEVIAGFENGVKEMKLNQEKTIKINPKDAYGEKNSQLIISVPRNKFPPELEVGGRLVLKGPQGQSLNAVVSEVKQDSVIIDLNHPSAGKELNFKVKVVAINWIYWRGKN